MRLLESNPFRILGVFADASTKEITANKTKIVRFSSIGKNVFFDADMDKLFSPLNRTVESVEKAYKDLTLPKDKIKHALTWFVKGGVDDSVLEYIKDGNYKEVVNVLDKDVNWQSLLNLGVMALLNNDAEVAVEKITTLIHDNECRNSFVSSVCGQSFMMSEDELARIFADLLMQEIEPVTVIKLFEYFGKSEGDYYYIKKKLTDKLVAKIKGAVSFVQDIDDVEVSYIACEKLIDNTKADLKSLRMVSNGDSEFGIIADNLATIIRNCSVNYYNKSKVGNYEKTEKSYKLLKYALKIAYSLDVKQKCQEQYDAISEIIKQLPPEKAKIYYYNIEAILERFCKATVFSDVINMIKECAPNIVAIKEIAGYYSLSYINISTKVVDYAIQYIDEVMTRFHNVNDSKRIYIQKEIWRILLYLDEFDMTESYRNDEFNPRLYRIKEIISERDGFRYRYVLESNDDLPNIVFNEEIIVDLNMHTEAEYFNSCVTKDDFNRYLNKYKNGKFTSEAKKKLEELEQIYLDSLKSYDEYKKYFAEHPNAVISDRIRIKMEFLEEKELWDRAISQNRIEIYKLYLDKFPRGKHANDAKKAIELKEIEQMNDEKYWSNCKNEKDYVNYLKMFKNPVHEKEAKEYLNKSADWDIYLIVIAAILALGVFVFWKYV